MKRMKNLENLTFTPEQLEKMKFRYFDNFADCQIWGLDKQRYLLKDMGEYYKIEYVYKK